MPTALNKKLAFRKSRRVRKVAAIGHGVTHPSHDRSVGALRRALGVPRSKFARLVGRTERAVIDWESGKAQPQGLSQQRVRELGRLTEALKGLFGGDALGAWFDTPNEAFGGLKPVEVIERGESDRLWQMIFELKAGMHG
jgi:DNA-binding transcriptional regulator YiaG